MSEGLVLSNCLNRITNNLREIKSDLVSVLECHPDCLSLGLVSLSLVLEACAEAGWIVVEDDYTEVCDWECNYSIEVIDDEDNVYHIYGDLFNPGMVIEKQK